MIPSLDHVADLTIEVGPAIVTAAHFAGLRRVVPILGGSIRGKRLNGVVLAAGADYQLVQPDGFTIIDARYAVRLDDGEALYIVNAGVRCGSPDVMQGLAGGGPVDAAAVYFRSTIRFEAGDGRHRWVTRPLFLAAGRRHAGGIELSVFEVG